MYIIILIAIEIICFVGIIYCLVQAGKTLKALKRNKKVYSYRTRLIHRCSPDVNLMEKLLHKYTYNEMLYSSKPLEDKYWFTPEEIEELNSNSYKIIAEKSKE